MGKRCCCGGNCKICYECDNSPIEAQSFDFTKSTVTFSGFQDWLYDQTYSGEFALPYNSSVTDTWGGYKPGDTIYNKNWFSFATLPIGNASVRYNLSLINMSILNSSYTFTKGNKTCQFFPDQERTFLGQIVAESFFEFTINGNLYSFLPFPRQIKSITTGVECNAFPFNCILYNDRFFISPISGWDGKIGTRIILDVYAVPSPYYPKKSTCGDHDSPVIFQFYIRETEPIATGIYSNYGKLKIQEVAEPTCFTAGFDGCPTTNCSWSDYNVWSSCLAPFNNSVIHDYDVQHTYFQYQDTRYPNQHCWRLCNKYLNHTNFSPFFDFDLKNYLFLIDEFENECKKYHVFQSPNIQFWDFCQYWNGANNTISQTQELLGSISFASPTSETSVDNSKIHDPCDICQSGSGIGYSLNFNWLKLILIYIFNRSSNPYQPAGIDNGGTIIENLTASVPTILRSNWGSGFVLNTTNGYVPPLDNPFIPPLDIYQCGFSKNDVPNTNWTLVSNLISSAWINGTITSPRFILTEPLQLSTSITYE